MKQSACLLCVVLGVTTACAGIPASKVNSAWTDEAKSAVLNQEVQIGMTADQVTAAWGQPWTKTKSVGKEGVIEVWKYGLGQYAVKTWLVFRDGNLVRIVR